MTRYKEVQTHRLVARLDEWAEHEDYIRERVRKEMARERLVTADKREVLRWTEDTVYLRFGARQGLVACGKVEASHIALTRREWFA